MEATPNGYKSSKGCISRSAIHGYMCQVLELDPITQYGQSITV